MADEVILLDSWPSPFGMRIRIALAEKGIEYEYKEENIRDKSSLLMNMNPVYKKIPVLIHNGKPICESLVILEYIDEVWKDKSPLLPIDPHQRAKSRFWADFINKNVSGVKMLMSKGEELENAKKEMIQGLKILEGELGEKSYFGGEDIGLIDVALIPYYSWFYAYEMRGKFSIEAECPKLVSWGKKCCMEKKSIAQSLPQPEKLHEFILKRRQTLGIE